jgi:hypothetical protein
MRFGSSYLVAIHRVLVVALACCPSHASADLLPFPLSANQRGFVYCLEKPTLRYDVYLPPAYSTNDPALPIIYSFNPSGGGMVTDFVQACRQLSIISVGIMGSANNAGWDVLMRESAAVTRDIRQRVRFDPTAEFAVGFSGGGEVAYMFSRFRAQHVAGVLEMAGWLGRGNLGASVHYYSTDRVQTNLLVARTTGNTDTAALFYNPFDSNYLAYCGAVVHDEYFAGGHQVPPFTLRTNCLAWLVNQRIPAGPNDPSNAWAQGADWRARIAAGQKEVVLRECVSALMNHPRSWMALEAQLVLDDLMLDYDSFRQLEVNDLAQGDFASDLFYHLARGAGDGSDWPRYRSALKALTGILTTNTIISDIVITGITVTVGIPTTNGSIVITGMNEDRAGDLRDLLLKYSYPAPVLRCSVLADLGQMNLWFSKDTPGLDYFLQGGTNLITPSWQELALSAPVTNAIWTTNLDIPPDSVSGFHRLRTTPAAGASPPWPTQ